MIFSQDFSWLPVASVGASESVVCLLNQYSRSPVFLFKLDDVDPASQVTTQHQQSREYEAITGSD
jgi:hypothetical protein